MTPPDAATVLYYIYQIDGKGADSYEVANGSVATYWFGHAFELGGTQYFTGFAWDTREKYGKPGEDDVGPDTQVNLAESTFTLTGSSAERPWKFRGMEHTIGMFGAYERPEAIDPRRKPIEYRTPPASWCWPCHAGLRQRHQLRGLRAVRLQHRPARRTQGQRLDLRRQPHHRRRQQRGLRRRRRHAVRVQDRQADLHRAERRRHAQDHRHPQRQRDLRPGQDSPAGRGRRRQLRLRRRQQEVRREVSHPAGGMARAAVPRLPLH
ncbi:hypothetical protein WJ972_25440 [Achromobacter insuavis]